MKIIFKVCDSSQDLKECKSYPILLNYLSRMFVNTTFISKSLELKNVVSPYHMYLDEKAFKFNNLNSIFSKSVNTAFTSSPVPL